MDLRRSRNLIAVGTTLAAAMAFTATVPGAGTSAAAPARHAGYPAVQPMLPRHVHFLASADAAPPGPGYSAVSRHFTPPQIQNSYNLPALYAEGLDGSGKTIAIVDSFGYPQAGADLEQFSKDYGLPLMCGMPDVACEPGMAKFSTLTFGNHQVRQAPDNQSPGMEDSNAWSVEVALDIEYAHTVAPGANILLVATPTAETLGVQGFPNMMDAEQYLVDHHLADVVTQSFGAAEGSFGSAKSLQQLRHAFQTGTAQGMTFLASSGDYGSVGTTKQPVGQGGSQLSTPQVGWPASDPLVTAVGGTTLCTDAYTGTTVDSVNPPADCQDNPGQREVGWNGSGGGFSQVFARPAYQDSLPAGSTTIPASSRGVPDISMNASCTSWVVVLDTAPGFGGYYGVCGTSEASPMFAGVVAIADQAAGHDLGLLNQQLYALRPPSYDVTSGNNTQDGSGVPGYAAGTGWDPVTGLGTPADAQAFVHALAGS
ncbi:MAG TPA: S53 family peptidase [Marmoricola sp.]|nr:S53 family peptidase [Marmoricola sp.]